MTKIENKMYRIARLRKADYMDYQDFCDLLPIVKNSINVECDADRILLDAKLKTQLVISNEYETFKNNIKFTKTMLAMKALRSITASQKTLEDCIIDFINYKKLSINSLEKHIKSNNIKFNIVFNSYFFNKELNAKNIDINKVKYIIEDKYKKFLLNERKYDKNEK